jgi:hypothetical protein
MAREGVKKEILEIFDARSRLQETQLAGQFEAITGKLNTLVAEQTKQSAVIRELNGTRLDDRIDDLEYQLIQLHNTKILLETKEQTIETRQQVDETERRIRQLDARLSTALCQRQNLIRATPMDCL